MKNYFSIVGSTIKNNRVKVAGGVEAAIIAVATLAVGAASATAAAVLIDQEDKLLKGVGLVLAVKAIQVFGDMAWAWANSRNK